MLTRGRADSEFWHKKYLIAERVITRLHKKKPLGDLLDEFYRYPTFYGFECVNEGVPVLKGEDINSLGLIISKSGDHVTADISQKYPRTIVHAGDLVISVRGLVGKVGLVGAELTGAQLSPNVIRLSPNRSSVVHEYLWVFLRSRFGVGYFDRFKMRTTQETILSTDISDFEIPLMSDDFQQKIASIVQTAQANVSFTKMQFEQAECILLKALEIDGWTPPEPLSYTRRSSEAFSAGRLDSQYFAPRVAILIKRLNKDGRNLRDVAPPRQEQFVQFGDQAFRYIEISNLMSDGTVTHEMVPMSEAPSRATWYVRTGDVLTSTVRPNRRLTALIVPEQDGCVASSGFVVLQPKAVPPEVLLTYLRLPLFCELMDLHTSASLYPAISERDLLSLPFPNISHNASDKVVAAVRSAHFSLKHAKELLEQAKRAVEIAIEDSEAAAIKYLKEI